MVRRSFDHSVRMTAITVALAVCVSCSLSVVSASAAPGPGWEVTSNTRPTNLAPGGKGLVELELFDIGASAPNGKVTVTDILPQELTAINAGEEDFKSETGVNLGTGVGIYSHSSGHESWECSGSHVVTCVGEPGSPSFPIAGGGGGAGAPLYLAIAVASEPGASGTFQNRVTVTGGDVPTPASTSHAITISSTPARL